MAIRKRITLAAPVIKNEHETLASFEVDYIYFYEDRIEVYLRPGGLPPVRIYLEGALHGNGDPMVTSKGRVVLNAAQSTRLNNFIEAIETACKANLELT